MNKRKYPCIMQHDYSDCAAASIASILKYYKSDYTIVKLREMLGTDKRGTTVKGILKCFDKLNFDTLSIEVDITELSDDLTYPVIAQTKITDTGYHFVVIYKVNKSKNKIIIADPADGLYSTTIDKFNEKFTGIVIFTLPKSEYEIKKYKSKGLLMILTTLIIPQKSLVLSSLLSSILLTIFGIFLSSISKILVDEIIPFQLTNLLFIFIIIFCLCELIKVLLEAFRQHVILFLSRKIDIPVMLGYFDHIIHLPYEFFINHQIGDIITRFQDAETIKNIFTNASISLILDISLSVISAIILYNINYKLFLILFLIILIDGIFVYIFKKPYKKINLKRMEASSNLNSKIIETIRNFETIKTNNHEKKQLRLIENNLVKNLKINFKEGKIQILHNSLSNLTISIGNVFFMCFGALFIINQEMSLGDLLLFQSLSVYFTGPIQNLVMFQISLQEAQIATKRLNELMQLTREDDAQKITDCNLNDDINFKNVTFSYGSRKPVIHNLNLQIEKGKKVGIIGESGSGKSTIARLLLNLITTDEGDITIGNISVNEIDHILLRNKIAYIPQNIELFRGTIMDNLLIGNPDSCRRDVLDLCKKTKVSDFIEKLPLRYDSLIEENGANLSGGEKQRLILTRALLKNPDILIFDEATSNLDSFNEKIIHKIIFDDLIDKTIIIIAHRLATIVDCDTIYIMEKGKIVASGPHKQLLSECNEYKEMIKLQTI